MNARSNLDMMMLGQTSFYSWFENCPHRQFIYLVDRPTNVHFFKVISSLDLINITNWALTLFICTNKAPFSHLLFLRTLAWWNGRMGGTIEASCILQRPTASSLILFAPNSVWGLASPCCQVPAHSVTNCWWIMSSRTQQFAVLGIMCGIFISLCRPHVYNCIPYNVEYIIYQMYAYYAHYLNKHMYIVYYSGVSIKREITWRGC